MTALDLAPLEAVTDRMDRRLVQLRARDDRRAIFLTVYRAMTGQMHRLIPSGDFLDPQWTLALTVRFASMYFEADDAYCADPTTCPAPWERAFAVAGWGRAAVLEHALLGINAHITYDLPRAVALTMRAFGDTAPDPPLPAEAIVARRRYDYEAVNEVLAATTDVVQDMLAEQFSPALRLLDAMALRFDEMLTGLMLEHVRSAGWNHAMALAYAQTPEEFETVRRHLIDLSLTTVGMVDLANQLPFAALRRAAHRLRPPFQGTNGTSSEGGVTAATPRRVRRRVRAR